MKKNQLQYSTVIGVATRLKHCFEALDVKMPDLEIERLSHFINIVYGTRNRAFHDVGHALGVGTGCTAIGQLAALFHDVVYLQVDRSRLNELRSLFGVFDPGDSLELTIPAQETLERDPWRHALVTLFGFKAGQKLGPFTGVNEFLSGWVAVQKLKNLVEAKELIQILACIEATIPFRGEQDAPSASEKLLANLRAASDLLAVNLNVTELEESIGEAVRVSNNDVMGFGLQEPEVFIYNSWALLYEGNPALQNDYYTLIKYREPLLRLESFLGSLNPRKIFLTYKNIPESAQLEKLLAGAAENISVARQYVRTKILDTAILEAFALLSGGDGPLELFTGPKAKSREGKVARIEHFIDWTTITQHQDGKNARVIRLLTVGREFRSKFDVKTALFAAYVYQGLTGEEFARAYDASIEFLGRKLDAENFLSTLPDPMLDHIGEVLAKLAWTRATAIRTFLRNRKRRAA